MKEEIVETLDEVTREETDGEFESFRELVSKLSRTEEELRDTREWKDSVEDSPTLDFDLSLLDREHRVLYYALKSGRMPIQRITDVIDRGSTWAYDTANEMEEKGWISFEKSEGRKLIRVEPEGVKELAETPAVEIAENQQNTDEKPFIRAHNIKGRYVVPESAAYTDYDHTRVAEIADWDWNQIEGRNAYITKMERVNIILNPDSIEIHLNKSYVGDPHSIDEKIIEDIQEHLLELDRTLPENEEIYSEFNFTEFEIFQAEIGVRNLPPVMLIHDSIENLSDIDFTELEHRSRNGQDIWIDFSPTGEGIGEIETEGYRFLDRVREYVKLHYRMFSNPLNWKDLPERTLELENEINRNTEFLRELNELTSDYFQTSSND